MVEAATSPTSGQSPNATPLGTRHPPSTLRSTLHYHLVAISRSTLRLNLPRPPDSHSNSMILLLDEPENTIRDLPTNLIQIFILILFHYLSRFNISSLDLCWQHGPGHGPGHTAQDGPSILVLSSPALCEKDVRTLASDKFAHCSIRMSERDEYKARETTFRWDSHVA